MYRKLTALALALAILGGSFTFTSTYAAKQGGNPRTAFLGNLVALFLNDTVDLNDTNIQVGLVNVNKSLNNLQVLNNVLRDADIIDDITIQDISILNNNELLRNAFQNFLNNNNIDLDAVVGVGVLGSGVNDLLIVTRQVQ